MPPRLADRLNAGRRRRFIGRSSELLLFERALTTDDPPFHVLFVYGPGGVGKSSLLAQFAQLCEQHHVHVWTIDARNIEAIPESFAGALATAMGRPPDESPAACPL
jgi:ATP/maltotriose-dependent transcriptional regulator MalT